MEYGGEGRGFEPCVPTSVAPGSIELQLLKWSALTNLLMNARTCHDHERIDKAASPQAVAAATGV